MQVSARGTFTTRGYAAHKWVGGVASFKFFRPQALLTSALVAVLAACNADVPTAPLTAPDRPLLEVVPGPGQGIVEVCKVGTTAAVTGPFSFTVSGVTNPVNITATGTTEVCDQGTAVAAGSVTVTEVARTGFVVSAINVLSGGTPTINVGNRTATVTVTAGQATTVRFTNAPAPTGFVEVCKVGTTSAVTGNFSFTVDALANPITLTATGTTEVCSQPVEVPVGNVVVTEAARAGFEVSAISAIPPGVLVSSNTATRTGTVAITAGQVSTIRFTNRPLAPGFLKICKLTPAGVTLPANFPTSFNFSVTIGTAAATTVAVPTGLCVVVDGPITAGTNVSVVEAAVANVNLTAITSIPATGLGAATGNVATRTGTATIASDITTEIRFTNAPAPVEVPGGFLKICKLTPAGVTLPANFPTSFNFSVTIGTAAATTVAVPTGLCVVVDGSIAAGTNVSVVEAAVANVTLTAITSIPATGAGSATGNVATRTATATIASNLTTEIRFTNAPALVEVPRICTLTKGFFRNHPDFVADRIAAMSGGVLAGENTSFVITQAILEATPGQPTHRGWTVTFTTNNLLNLTQQEISAILNLRGSLLAGPTSVDLALAASIAGVQISVNSTTHVISLTFNSAAAGGASIGDLISALDAFNEGSLTGFPHCDDDDD